ncbi:MAG: DNA-3-methyladenine glycosylase I [Pseudomonadales bacterium]
MVPFAEIYEQAALRKGGAEALESLLSRPKSKRSLKRITDDRYLAEMTACVFRSGFVWRVIEAKWPSFEEVFQGFDSMACAMLSDEDLDLIAQDKRIVRHAKKVYAVRNNALFVREVKQAHGSFADYIADWPESDIVGLWSDLKRRGDRLGGQTGRYFLRFMGKDTVILSRDVVAALMQAGVVDKEPTSQKALRQLQQALNDWMAQSGRSLTEISRILAHSTGD